MKTIFTKQELSKIFHQNVSYDISDICIDSKVAKIGDAFVALRGEKVDAHDFVEEAIEKGASLAIVEKKIESKPNTRLILCESSYNALVDLAKYNLERAKAAKYVCVTGSVGKTTVKDMIHHILSRQPKLKDRIYVSKKNFNSQIGLPVCASTMPADVEVGIFEMGMSATGDIKKLIGIIPPNISVVTNISEAHLEFFNSVFDVAKAKSEIFENGSEFAIIPEDSPYKNFLENKAISFGVKNIFSFGYGERSNARVTSCDRLENNIKIRAKILEKTIDYQIRCNNYSCVSNSVASILAAHAATGIDVRDLSNCLTSFAISRNRGGVIHINSDNNSIILMDDSYNASPAAMKSAIQSMSIYRDRRKIAIIGDMLELGSNGIHLHENLSSTIDKYGIDLVFACGSLSKYLYDNLLERKKGAWSENSSELAQVVPKEIKSGDCILVKGSRSMKMEYIIDAIKNKFMG